MGALTAAEIAAILFALLNAMRLLAYLPQILRIAQDQHGAEAISYCTWLLFALSHLSTALYAALVVSDAWMAWVFVANLVACIAVLGLTAFKRRALPSTSVPFLRQRCGKIRHAVGLTAMRPVLGRSAPTGTSISKR